MFHKIAIGATFSPNLKANLHEVSRLALLFDAELVLIHVGDETQDKKNGFHKILSPFKEKGLRYQAIFQKGDPVEVILQTTQNQKVDLLVIGALKKENFFQYYLGSIARKITRKAKCSTLLLINPSIKRMPCKHIVVNGLKDEKTKKSIQSAFYFGTHLEVEKLTIVEEIRKDELGVKVEDNKSLRKMNLAKEKIRLREKNRVSHLIEEIPKEIKEHIAVEQQAIFGPSGYSIGHYAQLVRADLLILNAPGKLNFWDRLFPHDLEHVLGELPTDVLIVQ